MSDQTLDQFIASQGITADVQDAATNPNMDSDQPMHHFVVTLRRAPSETHSGSAMAVPFSQGLGLTEPPTASDVLDCLASDASSVEQARDFSDWAADFGYSDDSIRALRTYETCKAQREHLEHFLGSRAFQTLIADVERL